MRRCIWAPCWEFKSINSHSEAIVHRPYKFMNWTKQTSLRLKNDIGRASFYTCSLGTKERISTKTTWERTKRVEISNRDWPCPWRKESKACLSLSLAGRSSLKSCIQTHVISYSSFFLRYRSGLGHRRTRHREKEQEKKWGTAALVLFLSWVRARTIQMWAWGKE